MPNGPRLSVALRMGRVARALTNSQATDIRMAHFAGVSVTELMAVYGISRNTTWAILHGWTYRDAPGPFVEMKTNKGRSLSPFNWFHRTIPLCRVVRDNCTEL